MSRKPPTNRFDELIERHAPTAKDSATALPPDPPKDSEKGKRNNSDYQQVSMLVRREVWKNFKMLCVNDDVELSERCEQLLEAWLDPEMRKVIEAWQEGRG